MNLFRLVCAWFGIIACIVLAVTATTFLGFLFWFAIMLAFVIPAAYYSDRV